MFLHVNGQLTWPVEPVLLPILIKKKVRKVSLPFFVIAGEKKP